MTAATVTVVCDLFDGSGAAITHGTAWFAPSVTLTDAADGMFVPQAPVPAEFRSRVSPSVGLLPTDDPSVLPSGWAWGVQFAYIAGSPSPYNFFLPAGPATFHAAAGTPCTLGWGTTTALTSLPDGTGVRLSGGSVPSAFSTASTYYVVDSAGTTVSLATSRGGSAIASASAGSGSLTVAQYNLSALSPVGTAVTMVSYAQVPAGDLGGTSQDPYLRSIQGTAIAAPPGGTTDFLRADGTWAAPGASAGVSSFNTRTGTVTSQSGDYTVSQVTGAAPLASPALTGSPTAPTQTTGDNSTKIATTAYVDGHPGITDWLNVVTGYGADPTGANDSTTAIQDAISAAQTAGGGVVYFPAGSYKTSSALSITGENITLLGAGSGGEYYGNPVQITQSSTSDNGLTASNAWNIIISGISFAGPGSGSGVGVALNYSYPPTGFSSLEDVYITGFGGDGLYIEESIMSTFTRVWSTGNGGYGIHQAAGTSSTFNSCWAPNNTAGGWFLSGAYHAAIGCGADTNTGPGWTLSGAQSCSLSGCGSEDNGGNGLYLTGSSYACTVSAFWCSNTGIGLNIDSSCYRITVIGFLEDPLGGATYSIQVAPGAIATLIGLQVTSPMNIESGGPYVNQILDNSITTGWFTATGLTGADGAASRYAGATTSGAPVSGTFAKGDFVIDQTGAVWVCTTAGTPGTWTETGGGGSGSVTSVSVATANGFAGTVANPTTTPAITVKTGVTGLLKGNGTAVTAATAGTDYLTPSGSGAALTGITVSQVSGAAPLASPALTGTPTAPTAAGLTDDTQVATTAYADAAVAVETSRAETAEALLAPKASPAFTGTPTAPTATALTDDTQVATTAYTDAAVAVETSRAETAEAAKLAKASNLSDVASQQTALNNLAGAVTSGDYLRGNGTNVTMSAIQAADVPTLNQNTTGTASNITDTLDQVPAPTANVNWNSHKITSLANGAASSDAAAYGQTPAGGNTVTVPEGGTGGTAMTAYAVLTGGTAATSPLQQVSGLGSSGYVLTSNGASALPTWQPGAGFSNPMTTLGDIIYENATPAPARLAGGTTAVKAFLTQTGTGSVSAAPAWGTITASDVPGFDGVNVSGVPSAGYYPRASGAATAAWGTIIASDVPGFGGVNVPGTASAGWYPRGASSTAASWGLIQAADLPAATTSTQGAVILDGTAGDIQASPATAAAGSKGQAADAKHVHPQPPVFAPTGLTGATAASRYVGATTSGAPASGTFAAGDFVIDQTAAVWVCTTAGTVGSGCVFTQAGGSGGGTSYASALAPASLGLSIASFASPFANSTQAMPNEQSYAVLATAQATTTINHLGIAINSAGATPGSGVNVLAIFSAAGTLLGNTADMTTAFESIQWAEGTLTSGVPITAGTNYYLWAVSSFTGSTPAFSGPSSSMNSAKPLNGSYLGGWAVGASTVPGSFTPSGLGNQSVLPAMYGR